MHWSARLATLLTYTMRVCAGHWRQANARLGRSEAVLTAIVLLLLLVGEGSVVEVLRRLFGE